LKLLNYWTLIISWNCNLYHGVKTNHWHFGYFVFLPHINYTKGFHCNNFIHSYNLLWLNSPSLLLFLINPFLKVVLRHFIILFLTWIWITLIIFTLLPSLLFLVPHSNRPFFTFMSKSFRFFVWHKTCDMCFLCLVYFILHDNL
jgi:hypothetical protein